MGFGFNAILLTLIGYFYRFNWISPQARPLGMSMRELFNLQSNRLQSTLQYPNTFAAYIGLGILAFLFIYFWEEKPLYRYLSITSMFILEAGFYFTYSRGALLIIILSFIYLLFILPRPEKKKIFVLIILFIISFLLFIPRLEYSLFNNLTVQFLVILLILGAIPAAIISFISFLAKKTLNILKPSWLYTILILVVVIISLIIIIEKPKQLNIELSNRFHQITFSTIISQERLIFYQDAFRVSMARPWFGWGGGGWEVRYLAYQSYRYFSKDPHNYYLQILIESGFLGLALMIGIIFSLLYGSTRLILKKSLNNKDTILVAVLSGLLIMGFAHCMIDVDFSLGAYQLSIWMFASIVNHTLQKNTSYISRFPLKKITFRSEIGLGISILFIIICLSIISGNQNQRQADAYRTHGNINLALQGYQEAVSTIPFNAESHYSLSRIYHQIFNDRHQTGTLERSIYHGEIALKISPYNFKYLENMAIINVEKGQFEIGIKYFTDAIYQAPYIISTYENYLTTCQKIAEYYLTQNQKKLAIKYLERALSVEQLFDQFSAKSLFPIQKSNKLIELLQKISIQLQDLRE